MLDFFRTCRVSGIVNLTLCEHQTTVPNRSCGNVGVALNLFGWSGKFHSERVQPTSRSWFEH